MQRLTDQTEKDFQEDVISLAHNLGWRVAHFRSVPVKRGGSVRWETPVQADGRGFPDLILVRERAIAAELKTATGKLSADQTDWLDALRDAGVEAYLWRPADVDDIFDILRRKEPR